MKYIFLLFLLILSPYKNGTLSSCKNDTQVLSWEKKYLETGIARKLAAQCSD